ncbi:MAG: serine/threonine protein kinase, partial [Candidatus Riflebacteria bacterium]|nr:serine/threonine protein kinase [Candidatus Riflebacteria bacterium]
MDQTRIGNYLLEEQLGAGGMAVVWRARQLSLGRRVALKMLHPTTLQTDQDTLRFRREMQLLMGLKHPCIVQILDAGIEDDVPFIAMELLEGRSLLEWQRAVGALPWPAALAIGARLAEGLAFIHENGLLHRDVKPSNGFLTTDGQVKLLDFGLARRVDQTALTRQGDVVGTVGYLCADVLVGKPHTARSDLWALGCVLYELLVDRRPVELAGCWRLEEYLGRLLSGKIVAPATLDPRVPAPLSDLVLELLAPTTESRPITAQDTAGRLDALLARSGHRSSEVLLGVDAPADRPRGAVERPGPGGRHRHAPPRPGRRRPGGPGWAGAAALVSVLAVLACGLAIVRPRPEVSVAPHQVRRPAPSCAATAVPIAAPWP